jgi:hypothetical protein
MFSACMRRPVRCAFFFSQHSTFYCLSRLGYDRVMPIAMARSVRHGHVLERGVYICSDCYTAHVDDDMATHSGRNYHDRERGASSVLGHKYACERDCRPFTAEPENMCDVPMTISRQGISDTTMLSISLLYIVVKELAAYLPIAINIVIAWRRM